MDHSFVKALLVTKQSALKDPCMQGPQTGTILLLSHVWYAFPYGVEFLPLEDIGYQDAYRLECIARICRKLAMNLKEYHK